MEMNLGHRMKVFMSRQMIACDEAGYLISKSHDTKLTFREKINLRIHLLSCHICRKYETQIRQLSRIVHIYRHDCADDNCSHHLHQEKKAAMQQTLLDELEKK